MLERSSIVVEEYLQAIFSLHSDAQTVKSIRLANRLNASPSTVHATLMRMQRDSLIAIGPKKEITLTEKGLAKAERLTRRHRLVETFLCNTLGVSWHEVHRHAHVLEHGLTPLVEEKLAEFLNFPEQCPHGVPIPGSEDSLPVDMIVLEEAEVGDQIEILTIYEALEESIELMKFFQEKSITPGMRHSIVEKMDITRTMLLRFDSSSAVIPFDIARQIGVVVINGNSKDSTDEEDRA